jgi:hypothetical protein
LNAGLPRLEAGEHHQPPAPLDAQLLLIERGDMHEIRNTGRGPLRTLNVYVPPAYTEQGEELPAGSP